MPSTNNEAGAGVLRMEHIVKDFPGVRALDHVNFEARAGEVLALVGENGAGKSTLMKVLSGVWAYPSYEGDIYIDGKLRRFGGVGDAEKAGIAIIHQELNLIPDLSVAENIYLNRQPKRLGIMIDWQKMYSDAAQALAELHMQDIDPREPVKELTIGKQQMVEIAKALTLDAKILVLDEPTSALTDREVEELFRVIRKLRKEGKCLIYISHKMEELSQIADRISVLRDGKTIGETFGTGNVSTDEIISRMVGRDIHHLYPDRNAKIGETILDVRHAKLPNPNLPGSMRVNDVGFELRSGEILGISGLMGAGRSELVMTVFGAMAGGSSEVMLGGKKLRIKSPADAIRAGIALVTEDRKLLGLIMGKSVAFNTTIASVNSLFPLKPIDRESENASVMKYIKDMGVKTPGPDTDIDNLSGGNQQKVLLARWLDTKPKVLILDEPTRGVDVGAKFEIYKLMNGLAEQGIGIIMVSSELPEILGMSDRVLVMREGVLEATLDKQEATRENVMRYATGA